MYYDRVLTDTEALYVDRAKQKIAELTFDLTEEYSRNDVDDYKPQLALELQYSIEVLQSTTLDWTEDEIQEMMDYYTIQGKLVTFGFVGLIYNPVGGGGTPGNNVYATVPQLNAVEQASIDRDAALQAAIDAEIVARIAGDAALQAQIDLFGVGGALTIEITSQVYLGAIYVGQVFPVGTKMEDIWVLALSLEAEVKNLTFDSFATPKSLNASLVITQFTWDVVGTPANMKLSDSEGVIVNQAVTGNSYTPSGTAIYNPASSGPVTWTITGDNIEPIIVTVNFWYESSYGKVATADDNPITVTEAMILGGALTLADTTIESISAVNTSAGEQGWIAVPKTQTAGDYTRWKEYGANQSDIAVGDFIRPPVDVIASGITYSVYRWGYRSPLISNLTLFK
jgi:hypothetical protein